MAQLLELDDDSVGCCIYSSCWLLFPDGRRALDVGLREDAGGCLLDGAGYSLPTLSSPLLSFFFFSLSPLLSYFSFSVFLPLLLLCFSSPFSLLLLFLYSYAGLPLMPIHITLASIWLVISASPFLKPGLIPPYTKCLPSAST